AAPACEGLAATDARAHQLVDGESEDDSPNEAAEGCSDTWKIKVREHLDSSPGYRNNLPTVAGCENETQGPWPLVHPWEPRRTRPRLTAKTPGGGPMARRLLLGCAIALG